MGKRNEKRVDRFVKLESRPRAQTNAILLQHHRPVGRNHIDAIRFHLRVAVHLGNSHGRAVRQDFSQHTFLARIEVLNDDECQPGIGRKRTQKFDKRFETARRSADADNRYAPDGEVQLGAGKSSCGASG